MPLPMSPGSARKRDARSEQGSILILAALSMVVLLGMVALAVDGSYMFTERNRMSAAADSGAISAALKYRRNTGASNADLTTFAYREATSHNFDPGVTTTVTVNRPPLSGAFTANPYYVEVLVSRPTATFFARILDPVWATMTPAARAVAGTHAGPNCVITLNQSGNPSLYIGQTVNMSMPACNIAANGNMQVGSGGGGSGDINAASVGVQGGCSGRCDADFRTGVGTPFADPLASMPDPTNPYSTPTAFSAGNGSVSNIPPGWYSSIEIGNNATVNFTPGGLYWISGRMTFGNQATVNGSDVMFYLAGTASAGACTAGATAGCILIPNTAYVTLTARSGIGLPYEGVLFFQARTNALAADFNNAGVYNLSGANYFPAAAVSYGNSGASNDCTMFVTYELSLGSGGGGTMDFTNTCALFGGSPILSVSLAE